MRFHEFMADDFAMVERIYDVAGQPFDARRRAPRWTRSSPTTRAAGTASVVYDLEGDFGIDPAERRAAMRDYATRFGTTDESATHP